MRPSVTIREMVEADIPRCVEITRLNWGDRTAGRTERELRLLLANRSATYYVTVEPSGVISGFAGMMPSWLMHDVWDFIWINIHPEFMQWGLGRALTEHRIKEVIDRKGAAIHLITQKHAFFKKFGFAIVRGYGHGWALMVRQLGEFDL